MTDKARDGGAHRQIEPGETRYAKSDDLSIAYQVTGEGPDLVFVPGSLSHVELGWETPPTMQIYRRLARFSRMITFDKRGMGLSDRSAELPTLEERMDDVRAVMDAADCESAAIVGISEGGPMSLLFAATYPDRVTALVLWSTFARLAWAPDYPYGVEQQMGDAFCDQIEDAWGTGRVWPMFSTHDSPDDEATRRHSPAWSETLRHRRWRPQPTAFRCWSTLVRRLARSRRRRWLSTAPMTRSPARARALSRRAHSGRPPHGVPGRLSLQRDRQRRGALDEIELFLTGTRAEVEIDRVLKTVLFTDIAGSTERAVQMGDRLWHELLTTHDSTVRRELTRFHGQEVTDTGDGFLASFDGPAASDPLRASHSRGGRRNRPGGQGRPACR